MKKNTIAIIDYGSQYTQLIARRVRELNVYSIILPHDFKTSFINDYNIKGIILSGGPSSVYDSNAPKLNEDLLTRDVPILGVCYGLQLLIEQFKGNVKNLGRGEYGPSEIILKEKSKLFSNISNNSKVWMSLGDRILDMPNKWKITSMSDNGIISSVESHFDDIYGVQFHPEVVHTEEGKRIVDNFLFKICNCIPNWSSANFIKETIKEIRETVKESKVLCALSGGVDSTVVSTIMKKAIGDNAICVFIDHGLLRKNEAMQVVDMFNNNLDLGVNLFD